MHWLIFEALSILFFSSANILQKSLMNNDRSDPHSYSIVFQMLGAILVGILAFIQGFDMPPIADYPINFLLMGVLYGSGTLFLFNALKTIEASEATIIASARPIFTILSAIILLHEYFNAQRGAGTILIISAVFLVSNKLGRLKFNKGFFYALGMALCYGLAITNDTFLLDKFTNVLSYLTISFLLPGIFLIAIKPAAILKLKNFTKTDYAIKMGFFTFLYLVGATLFYTAITRGALASQIAPVHQATVVITVILSFFLLKEKSNFLRKIIASALVIFGVILIT